MRASTVREEYVNNTMEESEVNFHRIRWPRAVIGLTVGVCLAACGVAVAATSHSIKTGLVVYAIPKDTINPYEVIADNGIKKALEALGGKVVVSSGTQDTAAAQEPSIEAAIQAHANAIIIAGNDPTALCPDLAQAQAAGITVVSFDSDVTCRNHLFINQANTKEIGTSEVDLLGKEIGYKGQIAILSAESTATNQNSWIKYMKQELKKSKYKNMKLVKIVYGNDDPATSLTVLQGLLSAYPNLRRHHLADHRWHLDRGAVPRHAQVAAQAPDPDRARAALADEEVRA